MPSVAESACLLLLGPERAPAVAARLASLLEKLEGRAGGTEGRASGQSVTGRVAGGGGGGAAAGDGVGGPRGGGDGGDAVDAGGSRPASPFRAPSAPSPLETDYRLADAAAAPPRIRATASAPVAPSAPAAPLTSTRDPLGAPLASGQAHDECHDLPAQGDLRPHALPTPAHPSPPQPTHPRIAFSRAPTG